MPPTKSDKVFMSILVYGVLLLVIAVGLAMAYDATHRLKSKKPECNMVEYKLHKDASGQICETTAGAWGLALNPKTGIYVPEDKLEDMLKDPKDEPEPIPYNAPADAWQTDEDRGGPR